MAAYEPFWYQNGQGGIVHWTGNDWRDVILPAIPLSHLYTQQMSYLIHGLEPDRKYEAKVQAKWVPTRVDGIIYNCSIDDAAAVKAPSFIRCIDFNCLLFICSSLQESIRMEWGVGSFYICHTQFK